MLFSIIVPVYKVEEYLPQCIESVLSQSFTNYELILVDDGSPDNSGKICDKYANEDSRINVIHKINGGLSDARNRGLSVANGEFVWFLDSDDYMVGSALSDVANIILSNSKLDMITCAHSNEYSDGTQLFASLPYDYSGETINRYEYLNNLYKSNGSYWGWKNIYKNSIIKENHLKFTKGLVGAEDCDFFMNFIRCGVDFSLLNIPVVNYRINREGSITNTMSMSAIVGQLKVFADNFYLYDKYNNKKMAEFFANKFANTISLLHYLKKDIDIQEVANYIKENKCILNSSKGLKYTLAKLMWSTFGYYRGSKILRSIK